MPDVHLWATDGYISTPDGKNLYIWGFTDQEGGAARLPGPPIIVKQKAPPQETTVNVILTNNLGVPVSLIFPGQEEVLVNGRPVQPQYENGALVSFTDFVRPGGTLTYTFTAANPGTFLYESGTNPQEQVPMGLYGTIIVRPWDYEPDRGEYQTAYGAGTGTEFQREYLLVLGELDPLLHQALETGGGYDIRRFKPRYWTINGRCANDTMLPDHAAYLPNQPEGAMVMMEPAEKVLLRYASAGMANHPLHPHGNHTRLVGLDGRLLQNRVGSTIHDLSYLRFTVLAGAGQTCDQIYTWTGLGFDPVSNPIPTTVPNIRNMVIGHTGMTMWSGSPYLGEKRELPPGIVSFNEQGEYHFMLHSHAEPEITNWGAFPGGLMTMIAVYPEGALDEHHGTLPVENTHS